MKLFDHFRRKQSPFRIIKEYISLGVRLRTSGLAAIGVRELELANVPLDLERPMSQLLLLFAERASLEKPSRDGDALGGPLLTPAQAAIQVATLRIVSRSLTPGSDELFRLVDYGEEVTAAFPKKLAATHLALLSEPSERKRELLLRRSIEVFPGATAKERGQMEFDRGENYNNYLAWFELGDVLMKRGKVVEGLEALKAATLRCPAWADDFAKHMREQWSGKSSNDRRVQFWLEHGLSAP